MNRTVKKKLLEIAKKNIYDVKRRGDLEARMNDEEDFIEVSVWGLEAALEESYTAGTMKASKDVPGHNRAIDLLRAFMEYMEKDTDSEGELAQKFIEIGLTGKELEMLGYSHLNDLI